MIVPESRKDALNLVFRSFPELVARFDGPDDEFMGDLYYVYGLLASEIVSRWEENSFQTRSCEFMNHLADSGDLLLEELLVVCLLEKIAEDATLAKRARSCMGERAAAFFTKVEAQMFGR